MSYCCYLFSRWTIVITCPEVELLALLVLQMTNWRPFVTIFCNNSAHFFTPLTQCILRLSCVRRVRMNCRTSQRLILEVYFCFRWLQMQCVWTHTCMIWIYLCVCERSWDGGRLVQWVNVQIAVPDSPAHSKYCITAHSFKPHILRPSAVLRNAHRQC